MKAADDFRVVCLGGSAGALTAYVEILRYLPADTGMAFVVLSHRGLQEPHLLLQVLSGATAMPVLELDQGSELKPNHVFLVPPHTDMTLLHGLAHLRPPSKPIGWPNVLSIFLSSLAAAKGVRAVAVILSGMDGDGSAALSAIKEAGGITFAQSAESADFDSMPHTAVETGHVDFVLAPVDIAAALLKLARSDTSADLGCRPHPAELV